MTKLFVESVGPATSIQDAGRFGAQRYGLVPSGAMDRLSLAAANSLAGNSLFSAAIEVGPLGMALTARDGAVRVALCGTPRNADVGKMTLSTNQTALITEGETLKLGAARDGVFSYLAVEGGIRGDEMFGSLSVNARSGLGSPYPRALRTGDELDVGAAELLSHERQLDLPPSSKGPIRVVLGPQDDEFGDAIKTFLDSEWTVSPTSDRMGYRLSGPKIVHPGGHNIVSDGTVNGSIQVPGSGQPIVLMMDRGTTGGYPKIATVISADLGRFAQTQATHKIQFASVTMAVAQDEARKVAALLKSLPGRVRDAGASQLNVKALQDANVAGVAINAVDAQTWQTQSIDE